MGDNLLSDINLIKLKSIVQVNLGRTTLCTVWKTIIDFMLCKKWHLTVIKWVFLNINFKCYFSK